MTENGRYVLLIACAVVLGSTVTYLALPPQPAEIRKTVVPDAPVEPAQTHEQPKRVRVILRGEGVRNPGIYRLLADSSVIEKSGGLAATAYIEGLPWEQKLYEGLTLTIPSRRAFQQIRAGRRPLTERDLISFHSLGEPQEESSRLLNINRATSEQLQSLPGIGQELASRIIRARESQGYFKQPEEIQQVLGIGEQRYSRIEPLIRVR